MPDLLLYFLHQLPSQDRKRYIFTNWLAKILAKDLGDYSLLFLPKMNQTLTKNLDILFEAFDHENEFSDLCIISSLDNLP